MCIVLFLLWSEPLSGSGCSPAGWGGPLCPSDLVLPPLLLSKVKCIVGFLKVTSDTRNILGATRVLRISVPGRKKRLFCSFYCFSWPTSPESRSSLRCFFRPGNAMKPASEKSEMGFGKRNNWAEVVSEAGAQQRVSARQFSTRLLRTQRK